MEKIDRVAPTHTIASICKDRRQLGPVFKALTQRLKTGGIADAHAYAVPPQLLTARLVEPPLAYRKQWLRFAGSLPTLVGLLRMNLFTHRELHAEMSAAG